MAKRRRRSRRAVPPPPHGIKYKDAADAMFGIKNKQLTPDEEPVVLLSVAIDLINDAIRQIGGPKSKRRQRRKKK
jgi:hypothetical protein